MELGSLRCDPTGLLTREEVLGHSNFVFAHLFGRICWLSQCVLNALTLLELVIKVP
jgi:hypothetical protein